MKKTVGGLLVLATVMATGAADLTAQQGRRGAQMGADRGQRGGVERIMQMRERLELTDNQLAQLDALRSTSVARRTAAMAQISELQSQLAAGQIERSDFMAAMEGRRDETEGVAEAHRTQIKSLLTDAQRETLEQASQRGRAFRAGVAAGMSGVAQAGAASVAGGARSAMGKATGPLRRSFQSGGRGAFAATGGSPNAGSAAARAAASSSIPANNAPDWARTVRREQMQRDAGLAATSVLRDGDRGGSGDGPRLKQDEE